MCGRFVSATPPDELARYFGAAETAEAVLGPSWNVAPTSDIYAVRETGGVRRLDVVHWGLVPFWAKDLKVGNRMINARAETLTERSAFKKAFVSRRSIIPADGFYEWKIVAGQKRKQPYYIKRADGEPLAVAGLWEAWRGPDRTGEPLVSATIITCAPNETMAEIHDRMPVLLPPDAWDRWLDPDIDDLDLLAGLLVPAPSELIVAHPVGTDVNNMRNQGADLTTEVPPFVGGVGGPGSLAFPDAPSDRRA